jgi:peptidoglycan/LPS O-acetylase OafA/YrhL
MTERGAFRPDIQGLRAIAVLFVIVYHVWPDVLPGGFVGVDVFFVLSGFLITGLLLKELESTGRISLGAFYVRRMKRLLPAATLVLVVVALSTVLLLPSTRWRSTAYEVIASALYVENWLLLRTAVDYWAQGAAHSPVMHYWSLSIEEQFYFVWPGLLALCGLAASRLRIRLVPSCLALVGLVFGASLAYSIHYSAESGAAAYFSSLSRAWELALGALTCLALRATKRPPVGVVASVLGWLALGAVMLSVFVIDDTSPFPGAIALLPTLATAMLLLTGSRSRRSPAALLETRPLQVVGDLSYSLYLWHWPLVVLFQLQLDREPRVPEAAVLLIAMLALAYATQRLVEEPVRFSQLGKARQRAAFALGAACILVSAAAAALPLQLVLAAPPVPLATTPSGAQALVERHSRLPTSGDFVPAPIRAKEDLPALTALGCHLKTSLDQPRPCELGPEHASRRVALVGDSHAFQWVPALAAIADAHELKVISITKTGCPLTDVMVLVGRRSKRPYSECERWNQSVKVLLRQLAPDLVIASQQAAGYDVAGAADRAESSRLVAEGSSRSWRELIDAGIPVLVVRDTPAMGSDVPDCVARHPGALERCEVPRDVALPSNDPVLAAARGTRGVRLADLGAFICDGDRCPPVVGGVLVYRDDNHLTATYTKTLAPMLWQPLRAALERAR